MLTSYGSCHNRHDMSPHIPSPYFAVLVRGGYHLLVQRAYGQLVEEAQVEVVEVGLDARSDAHWV